MATGNTLCLFFPQDNEPPAANYATLDTRNGHPVLDFDATTGEDAIFTGVMPQHYSGGGITVFVAWAATSAVAGTIGWLVALEAMKDGGHDIDADSFAANATIVAATTSGTSGIPTVTSVSIANGTAIDSIVAGDTFRIKITRDVGNDNAAGDAELLSVEIRET